MEQAKSHIVDIDNRKSFSASGISDVLSFNEREVRMTLAGGGKLIILGDNLKIDGFSKQSREVRISGLLRSLRYGETFGSHGFFK